MSNYGNIEYEKNKNAAHDCKGERVMNTFLVECVYPELVKAGVAKSIKSIVDADLQEKGVDAIWTLDDGTEIYFDNKNRASALNTYSAAVPFELRTNRTDGTDRHDGWLTLLNEEIVGDNTHLTDYILFIHPFSKKSSQKNFNEVGLYDIKEVDILLVRVDEVFEYLSRYYKLSFKDIYNRTIAFDEAFTEKTEGMTNIPTEMRKCSEGFERGMRQCLSRNNEEYISYDAVIHTSINSYMPEDPTNLLLREDVCKTFSHTRHFHYDIYKGLSEFYDIKERRELSKKS